MSTTLDSISSISQYYDSSETDHSVNAQVPLWLLCDCYSGNPHSIHELYVVQTF